jgi:antitoxin (DNA-binding transcriptional repressor) of toxin-antitoxin stability system
MKQIALSDIKHSLPRFLREAASEPISIPRHGRPAGVLVGFSNEDDWLEYRLQHDPRFLRHIARARASIQAGHGVRLEDLDAVLEPAKAPAKPRQPTARRARRAAEHHRATRP